MLLRRCSNGMDIVKYKGWTARPHGDRVDIYDRKGKHVCHVICPGELTVGQIADQIEIAKELKRIWRVERLRSWRR